MSTQILKNRPRIATLNRFLIAAGTYINRFGKKKKTIDEKVIIRDTSLFSCSGFVFHVRPSPFPSRVPLRPWRTGVGPGNSRAGTCATRGPTNMAREGVTSFSSFVCDGLLGLLYYWYASTKLKMLYRIDDLICHKNEELKKKIYMKSGY